MAKKNNKKRNNNNNQNKNNAKKKEKILQTDGDFFETMKNIEKEAIKEIEEETNTEKKVEEKVEIKEEQKEVKETTEKKEEVKDNKAFNRRFWIDVVLLLLVFVVIGIIFAQIMSNSLEVDTTVNPIAVQYEIKNSTLDMSIEEYINSVQKSKSNASIFNNLENKEINEYGKDESIYYYQGLLGEDNMVGIVTKEVKDKIVSIDFISRKDNEDYKEDFKRIIANTLYSSGLEEKDVSNVIDKFKNRESFDKTFNNVRVFMEYSSKDYYVTKIIYNRRLATRLKNIYSKEISDLVGDVD